MHIACFHLVVTPLVFIHQEWWVLEHEVHVVEQSICISRGWCWLCIQPVITTRDDVGYCCEVSLEPLESLRDGIIRISPSEPFVVFVLVEHSAAMSHVFVKSYIKVMNGKGI